MRRRAGFVRRLAASAAYRQSMPGDVRARHRIRDGSKYDVVAN